MSDSHLSGRTLPVVCLVLIMALAAVLRLDALTARYGLVSQPELLRVCQRSSQALVALLRDPVGPWSPAPLYPHKNGPSTRYQSDPYTYLERAREMRSFYGAHYREPVFPFAVKVWLWLLHDQDVAVSFASASFSLLCVLFAYFVGSMAFSRWVGCAAALGFAVEREVIAWSVQGWRDDAFAFAVMLSVCTMLFYRNRQSAVSIAAVGLAAALACLTRIFSVSFLAAGFLYLLLRSPGPWRRRARDLSIAGATMVALVLPYLVNCWRVYGDPLYTLNYQPLYYLASEGLRPDTPPGAVGYIATKLLTTPFETLDTLALGMTTYPFLNKWGGFEPWASGLGHWLAVASVVGLMVFAASRNGRLLLLILASAQVPFAFTWKLSSDWRYTEFAYPFFLVATGLVITSVTALARPSQWRRLLVRQPSPKAVYATGLTIACMAIVAWTILRIFPVLTFREALLTNRPAAVVAGARDNAFFREGWSERLHTGNVTARSAHGPMSVIDVPLPPGDYDITVRLDPYPPPSEELGALPAVRIFFNGVLLRTVDLTWNPERVGSYTFDLPRTLVRPRGNRFTFMVDPRPEQTVAADSAQPTRSFRLWYVLARPG